jgi:hypothetical protein
MQRIIAVLLTIFVVINLGLAEETAFRGVKLADAKGKQGVMLPWREHDDPSSPPSLSTGPKGMIATPV